MAVDPTRTTDLRQRLAAEITRRVRAFRLQLRRYLVTDDALGLRAPTPGAPFSPGDKVKAFGEWVRAQLAATLLRGGDDPTLRRFARDAFVRGYGRSAVDARRVPARLRRGRVQPPGRTARTTLIGNEVFTGSFGGGAGQDVIDLLEESLAQSLSGFAADVAAKLTKALADGLAAGKSIADIAKNMDAVAGIGLGKATLIAQTEIIKAYAAGQLQALEDMGVTELGVQVEFRATGDGRTCPICAGLNGKRFKIQDAKGVIPVHPRCRCAWIPYVPLPSVLVAAERVETNSSGDWPSRELLALDQLLRR